MGYGYTSMLSSLLFFLLIPIPKIAAQGGLMVIPKRVVFDGKKRVQELSIANWGTDTVRYNISVVEMKMSDDGAFKEITTPEEGQHFASDYIRIYPKSITLGPNESQKIKVQLTNTQSLPHGEYRSHISFNVIANKNLIKPPPAKMVTNLFVKLVPLFSITIPVIIRVGDNTTTADFSNFSFEVADDTLYYVNTTLNRRGDMSLYGNISVEHVSAKGLVTHVAYMKGLAVYVPNKSRRIRIKLNNSVGVDYEEGKLQIKFSTLVEDRPVKMAEAEFNINNEWIELKKN